MKFLFVFFCFFSLEIFLTFQEFLLELCQTVVKNVRFQPNRFSCVHIYNHVVLEGARDVVCVISTIFL